MEVAEIFALLVLQYTQKVTHVHLEVSAEPFAHQRHQLLKLAEPGHREVHCLRVLHTFQIFLQFTSECTLDPGFEVTQLIRVPLKLLLVFSFEKAAFLSIGQWATLLIHLGLEPLLGCVFDGALEVAQTG